RHIIECTFHVERWPKRFTTHPEHAGPPIVGKHLTTSNLINVFRGQCYTNDLQLLPFAVYDCRQRTSWLQTVGGRERTADKNFVSPSRFNVSPIPEIELIQHRPALFWNGNDSAFGGFV